MIYFVQALDGGPIKIGYTENIDSRLKQLEASYGRTLIVLATMDGGYEEEQEVHARFAHLRMGRTEQFIPGSELMTFIGKPVLACSLAVVAMNKVKSLFTMKCHDAFKAWLTAYAKEKRHTPSQLVEIALIQMAKADGYPEPPER